MRYSTFEAKKSAADKHTTVATSPKQLVDLDSGQKQEITIKLANLQKAHIQVEMQLDELVKHKKTVAATKEIQSASKIDALIQKLEELETKLDEEIKNLQAQLAKLMVGPQASAWLNKIKSDCGSYLEAVSKSGKWLYRGGRGPLAYKAKSWTQRFSKDSEPEAQTLFDQKLAELGFVALRGNSIFATSDRYQAKEYGPIYVIFPVDGESSFSYTTAKDIVLDTVDDVGIDLEKRQAWADGMKDEIKAWRKNNPGPTPKPLLALSRIVDHVEIHSWHQIQDALLKVQRAPALKLVSRELLNININDWITTSEFVKRWEPKKTDLAAAIKSGVEVYISGSYYALDWDTYKQVLQMTFNVPHTPEKPTWKFG
jgi:hypothetical protein